MARILLISTDYIGTSMAGPGIRCWEFARALSKRHEVTLLTPNDSDLKGDGFDVKKYIGAKQLAGHHLIISQTIAPLVARTAARYGVRIILDAYDPVALENLEIHKSSGLSERHKINDIITENQNFSFTVADGIICASETQRDMWLGVLSSLGRVSPDEYDRDPSLRSLIEVVPFGIQNEPPVISGPGPREQFGIDEHDFLVLWGGGVWDWFDPLTVIKAMAEISRTRNDIKLVFMGMKHPNPNIKDMSMAKRAVKLAKELDLEGKQVFFNYQWVPYAKRANYFLQSNAGISTHYNHLETHFSFRTRMLDYIWAGLPIVATEGDSFSDLIAGYALGRVVAYENVDDLAGAIEHLADHPADIEQIKQNLASVKNNQTWEQSTLPLLQMVDKLLSYDAASTRGLTQVVLHHYRKLLAISLHEDGPVVTTIKVIKAIGGKVVRVARR